MAVDKRVRAPYNFIPLSDKILLPYDSVESLPAHDRIDPSLKTGEICVTMVADTPVFVSDGDKNDPHFFRGSNGKYMIPGSTIRGMVRENMQILGFGLMRPGEDLEDIQIYFREIASASGSRDDPLKKYYCAALGIKQMPMPSGRAKAIPQLVKSGYLKKEKGKYKIYPSKGSYMLVRRDHPGVRCFGTEDARTENVYYRAEGDRVKEIRPAVGEKNGLRRGTLLYTGKPVRSWNRQTGRLEDHPNHLYLIPEADWSAQPLTLDEDDVLSYMEDFEKRRNVLGRNRNFWNLPLEGREKPVFYVQYEGHVYFGMSRFLRIGYRYPLSCGLPESHKAGMDKLDFPRAILGYVSKNSGSYRSRVSFGDFAADGEAYEMPLISMILGEPKPSYYPGYVVGGKHYNHEDFRLRGYKQYWLKELRLTEGKDSVTAKLRPLPKGTRFNGILRYRNLTEDELGLLLWSLRLEDGCYQTIGMGKPCGLGRMKLTIKGLREYSPAELYCSGDFNASTQTCGIETVNKYIEAYDTAAGKNISKKPSPLHNRKELKDFFFMKRMIRPVEEASYMTLDEYRNIRSPLPTVQSIREEEETRAAEAKPMSEDEMKAALLAKFGSKYKK